jgi:hypothetical protein
VARAQPIGMEIARLLHHFSVASPETPQFEWDADSG